jgi:hypothetical protein
MADGHQNKCKSCTIQDVEKRRKHNKQDLNWVLSERKRKREYLRKCKIKFPEKKKARTIVQVELRSGRIHRHPCFVCGNKAEAHHEDYSKPLDIIWLCRKHHAARHIEINEERLKSRFNTLMEQ